MAEAIPNIRIKGVVRSPCSTVALLVRSPVSGKDTPRAVKHVLGCECPVCIKYRGEKRNFELESEKPANAYAASSGGNRLNSDGFAWLIEQLGNIEEPLPITVCAFRIPEIVLWKDGVPRFILRLVRNKFVKVWTKRMTPRFVQLNFCVPECSLSPASSRQHSRRSSRAYSSTTRSGVPLRSSALLTMDLPPYKAIMREAGEDYHRRFAGKTTGSGYSQQHKTRLLSERDLVVVLSTWTREQLKRVQTIHAYTKLTGIKQSVIRVHVSAPLVEQQNDQSEDCPVPFICLRDTVKQRVTMCKEICRKLCQSLARCTDVEIYEMKAEFITTELEYMLDNAWDIVWKRRDPPAQTEEEKNIPYSINVESLSKLMLTLNRKEGNFTLEKAEKVGELRTRIDKHVKDIRQVTGVNDKLKADPKDPRSDDAFARLRPLCPYRMTDMLFPKPSLCRHLSPNLTREARRLPKEELLHELLYSEHKDKKRAIRVRRMKRNAASQQFRIEAGFAVTREATIRSVMSATSNKKRRSMIETPTEWLSCKLGDA